MIVWSGRGFLSFLVFITTLFLSCQVLPDSLSDYGFVIACFVSAGFSWIFGIKWNKQNERIVIDDKTGQKYRVRTNHSLFWIPMQYWGMIFSIIGIIILRGFKLIMQLEEEKNGSGRKNIFQSRKRRENLPLSSCPVE
ncbi:MAG: hypothetical protein M0P12_10300, partial [Paludibacteraceae bacterium]|nr:hypothetical protein [Paludibacteraceae bacterium]